MSPSEQKHSTRELSDEEMDRAVEQIVFDLGVEKDKARQWAEEAQEELINERDGAVTKVTVAIVADTAHVGDEDVPAEFVPRTHEGGGWHIKALMDKIMKKHKKGSHD